VRTPPTASDVLIASVLLAAVIGLSGCSTGTETPPTPTPTSTPTPTPAPATAPTPRFDLSCEDLVDPAVFVPLDPTNGPIVPIDPALVVMDPALYTMTNGGLHCTWANTFSQPGTGLTIRVDVMPAATEAWAAHLANIGMQPSTMVCGENTCKFEELIGEYWVGAEVFANVPLTAVTPSSSGVPVEEVPVVAELFNRLRSEVTALGAPDPVWTSPNASALPTTCEALIPSNEVGAALGLSSVAPIVWAQTLTDISRASRDALGGVECAWDDGGPASVASIQTLPGGAWLEDAYRTAPGFEGFPPPTVLAIGGVEAPNVAYQVCKPGAACNVDLFFEGNWLHITGAGDGVVALATALVAGLGGAG
jgi:hypothetical protein